MEWTQIRHGEDWVRCARHARTSDAGIVTNGARGKGVTRAGTHPGHFQGTMGLDLGGRAAGFVPTRTNLLLRPVNRLPGGGI